MTYTSGVVNYGSNTGGSLRLQGNSGSNTTLPSISFNYNDSITNLATIQAEDTNSGAGESDANYTFSIVFYTLKNDITQIWQSGTSGASSNMLERLRICAYVSDTGTTVKVKGICEASAGFNVSSALKYKTNIHDLPDNYNLDMLMKYRPIMYNLKVDESEKPIFFPGFIAEEIDDLGANLFVTYKDEKPESLDYSRICVHLIKAMQEMKTDYDAKISKLEQNYEEMKIDYDAKISKLEQNYEEMKTLIISKI